MKQLKIKKQVFNVVPKEIRILEDWLHSLSNEEVNYYLNKKPKNELLPISLALYSKEKRTFLIRNSNQFIESLVDYLLFAINLIKKQRKGEIKIKGPIMISNKLNNVEIKMTKQNEKN